jgi:hypothetical protein
MRQVTITLPELGLVAGTRAALGVGIGMLVADLLPESQHRAIGWTLCLVGALTTVPLAFDVLGHAQRQEEKADGQFGGRIAERMSQSAQ